MPVVRPNLGLTQLPGGEEMNRVGRTQKPARRQERQLLRLEKDRSSYGRKVPEPSCPVSRKNGDIFAAFFQTEAPRTPSPVNRAIHLGNRKFRRSDRPRIPHQRPNCITAVVVDIHLHDVGRVQVQLYISLSRSSLISSVESPSNTGILAQNFSISSKGNRTTALGFNGCNSATGSPRRSMIITSPLAASLTSSEVLI